MVVFYVRPLCNFGLRVVLNMLDIALVYEEMYLTTGIRIKDVLDHVEPLHFNVCLERDCQLIFCLSYLVIQVYRTVLLKLLLIKLY